MRPYMARRGRNKSRKLFKLLGIRSKHYMQSLAPHFRSLFAVPLEHRLKMSLQAAEHWLSTIAHQVKVTHHIWSVLLSQHHSIKSHLRTMRRKARHQAKERMKPAAHSNARSCEIQAEVKAMRNKLYSKKAITKKPRPLPSRVRNPGHRRHSKSPLLQGQQLLHFRGPTLRHHPPNYACSLISSTIYESSCRRREAQSSMRQTGV